VSPGENQAGDAEFNSGTARAAEISGRAASRPEPRQFSVKQPRVKQSGARSRADSDRMTSRGTQSQNSLWGSSQRRSQSPPTGDLLRPELPSDVDFSELDSEVRKELATLPKGLAELVGSHLVAAARVLEHNPQLALAHTRFARSKAGRVAAVREAAGLAAYIGGEWSEALTELRAARRLSGGPGRLAVLADCERALGRPERALEIARSLEAGHLDIDEMVELRIVAAGARRDLGQFDAAVIALQGPELDGVGEETWRARLRYAYADNLLAAGRKQDAIRWFLAADEADVDGAMDAAERAVELSKRLEVE
jgi:tetratricopeptide (TPR) repeat protein